MFGLEPSPPAAGAAGSAAVSPDSAAPRHLVFLQGMPSAFFSRVARELRNSGCRTTKIRLCTGDHLFWNGGETLSYRGTLAQWPRFLERLMAREGVTDLVLLGEQRPYHKPAVAAAHACGVRVSVMDYGYLRPDWITLERDGMSGASHFPRSLDRIQTLAESLPPVEATRCYQDSTLAMAVGDLVYNFSNVFFFWLYPHYRQNDVRPHPLVYFPAMGRRLLFVRRRERRALAQMERLLAARHPLFVFPLQLEHDFQIVAYSPAGDLLHLLGKSVASFAAHAPRDARLVVKVHPWDPGLRDWPALVHRLAAEHAVAERVELLDGGDLEALARRAHGMVTVNSTSGLAALQAGCPVKVLGQAIFDIPGLTFQGELDAFWRQTDRPEAGRVEALVRTLAGTIQLRGVFFRDPGASAAAKEAGRRLSSLA